MRMSKKYSLKKKYFLILISFIGINYIYSQSNKQVITVDDIKLWRNHSVTLSDDGNWYTVLYSLSEKTDPEKIKKSLKNNSKKKRLR